MELINDPAYQHHVRRAAAQTYARHGWSVIPLTSGKKHPPLVAWKTYATERPTLDRVRRWFQRWPTANIGVVTGAVSGITVLDVDVKPGKRGDHTLAALVEKHGSLPLTAQQQTWSGGTQFLFAHAPGVRNSSGAIGPGLDIRGEGGYIVVAPSIVETEGGAGSYVWKTPWNVPLAPMPSWLLSHLADQPHALSPSRRSTTGGRHDTLFRLARSLRFQARSDAEIIDPTPGEPRSVSTAAAYRGGRRHRAEGADPGRSAGLRRRKC
jgi:hypothetical protein